MDRRLHHDFDTEVAMRPEMLQMDAAKNDIISSRLPAIEEKLNNLVCTGFIALFLFVVASIPYFPWLHPMRVATNVSWLSGANYMDWNARGRAFGRSLQGSTG